MTDKIISMAEAAGDGTMQTPLQCLESAIKDLGTRPGAFKNCKKILVLALDDNDGNYEVSFAQAGMHMSECNNLCDIAKAIFKNQMGYVFYED